MTEATNTQAKRVGWVLRGTQYAGASLLTFVALAERSNEQGYCWPSIATIVEETRCSKRAVQYSLRQLVKDGWLIIHRQKGQAGQNIYRLNTNRLEKNAREFEARKRSAYLQAVEQSGFSQDSPKTPVESCGNPEDKPTRPVEIGSKVVEKPGVSCGKAVETQVVRVQTGAKKGATRAPKGCKAFAPKPPGTPTNPHGITKAKADYGDGDNACARETPASQPQPP